MPGFGPIGSTPLGTLTIGGLPPEPLSSTAVITAKCTAGEWMFTFADSAVFGSALTGYDLPCLYSSMIATGSASPYFTFRNNIASNATFSAAINAAWSLLLTSTAVVTGTATVQPLFLGSLVDTLILTGAASTRLVAISALTAAMAFNDLLSKGWGVAAVDSAVFGSALANAIAFFGPLVSTAAMAATDSDTLRITVLASDNVVGATTLAGAMTLQANASDNALVYATLRLGNAEYVGWVLNTDNKAASEYTNYHFDSLATFQNRTFGAGNGGIFELVGATDDGAQIVGSIRTGLMDFGTGVLKNIPDVYLGFTSAGDVVLKVVTTSATGAKVEDWYRKKTTTAAEVREGRIDVGRGLQSRFWSFELCNTAGAVAKFSDVDLRPVLLSRRV